ncbi:MAG: LytTR family transcriptional regulator DNA-binding domain-containing protein [Proteobacteria bacterium]|nr:LytTR family transcriptional regulator DNA-binding domain-containing protein [Pseudomonadota bacterium]
MSASIYKRFMAKNLYFLFGVFVFVLIALKAITNNFWIEEVIAEKGTIDLESYDLDKDVVALNGEWEFYWAEQVLFGDSTIKKTYNYVPEDWNHSKKYKNQGFATYRLEVLLPQTKKVKTYGLYLNRVGSAYTLFVNGNEKGSNGVVGRDLGEEIPHRETQVIYFDLPPNKPLEITMQVSNYHHLTGGIKTGILFSSSKKVQKTRFGFLAVDFLAVAILTVLVIVYSSIYIFKPEKQFLYFILFLVFICIYVAGTGENVLGSLFPGLPWLFFMKLIHLCMALHFFYYNNLLNLLYPNEKIPFFYQIVQKSSLVFSVICLVASVKVIALVLPVFHGVIFLSVCYWMVLMGRAILNNKRDSIIIFLGLCIYAIAVALEVAYVNQLARNPRFVPIGILFFSLSYVFVNAREFASSYKLVEKAENEKHKAIAQAHVEKAAFLAEKERSSILHQTLTDSESISQVDKIRVNLRQISYIMSESGGSIVYGDKGERLFDLDLTLKRISEIFGTNNQLIRCSKAYIVNPSKARKVVRNNRRYELQFINSEIENVPVGNKYVTEIRSSIQVN